MRSPRAATRPPSRTSRTTTSSPRRSAAASSAAANLARIRTPPPPNRTRSPPLPSRSHPHRRGTNAPTGHRATRTPRNRNRHRACRSVRPPHRRLPRLRRRRPADLASTCHPHRGTTGLCSRRPIRVATYSPHRTRRRPETVSRPFNPLGRRSICRPHREATAACHRHRTCHRPPRPPRARTPLRLPHDSRAQTSHRSLPRVPRLLSPHRTPAGKPVVRLSRLHRHGIALLPRRRPQPPVQPPPPLLLRTRQRLPCPVRHQLPRLPRVRRPVRPQRAVSSNHAQPVVARPRVDSPQLFHRARHFHLGRPFRIRLPAPRPLREGPTRLTRLPRSHPKALSRSKIDRNRSPNHRRMPRTARLREQVDPRPFLRALRFRSRPSPPPQQGHSRLLTHRHRRRSRPPTLPRPPALRPPRPAPRLSSPVDKHLNGRSTTSPNPRLHRDHSTIPHAPQRCHRFRNRLRPPPKHPNPPQAAPQQRRTAPGAPNSPLPPGYPRGGPTAPPLLRFRLRGKAIPAFPRLSRGSRPCRIDRRPTRPASSPRPPRLPRRFPNRRDPAVPRMAWRRRHRARLRHNKTGNSRTTCRSPMRRARAPR